MFKKTISFLLCILMLVSFLPVSVYAYEEVKGDFMQKINQITWEDVIPEGYTTISTEAELEAIANDPSGIYILMEDIELESFKPLCSSSKPFTGVLEGNGHTISGINVTSFSSSSTDWGLFRAISGARISNLKLSGSVAAETYTGKTKVTYNIGSLAGTATGDINIVNCVNAVSYDFSSSSKYYDHSTTAFGGLIGYYSSEGSDAQIVSCRNIADINTTECQVGGIIGNARVKYGLLTISNCQNDGSIVGEVESVDLTSSNSLNNANSAFHGGIAGIVYGDTSDVKIHACLNNGRIAGTLRCGGIAGDVSCSLDLEGDSLPDLSVTVSSCANTATVEAKGWAGGIVGDLSGIITDCLNTGSVGHKSNTGYLGGIAGESYSNSQIIRCINTGDVIGYRSNNSAITMPCIDLDGDTAVNVIADMIIDCYWLKTGTSTTLYSKYYAGGWYSSSAPDSQRGLLTAAEMTVDDNFNNFEFDAIWTMDEELGHPYPTALLTITLENYYHIGYIDGTIGFANDSEHYRTLMGGSGDGSFAGILGKTYEKSASDEVNGIWSNLKFESDLVECKIPNTTDYDILLADLVAGAVSRDIRSEHITSTILNATSTMITLLGKEMDIADILQAQAAMEKMSKLPVVYNPYALTVIEDAKTTAVKKLSFKQFGEYLDTASTIVSFAEVTAAGIEDISEAYDFYVLCNAQSETVRTYTEVIQDAAYEAMMIERYEGGNLYTSAQEFSTTVRNNTNGNKAALYEASGAAVKNLTVTAGSKILEKALKITEANPALIYITAGLEGFTVGMSVGNILTNMDKIAYYGRMMEMADLMARGLHAEVLERRDTFLHSQSYEDAQALNAASNLYLNLQVLACDYGIGYSSAIASSSMSNFFHMNMDDLAAIVQLQALKADLGSLQEESNYIYIGEDGSINGFIANCPVTVVVTDSNGNEIARMKTGSITTADGYGGSYMLLGSSGEHKAGLYDPNEHTVTIIGEGSGTMTLVDYGSKDGSLTYVNTYRDVPIEEGTTYVITPSCLDGETDVYPVESGTEHTYTASVTAPTCVSQGYTTYTCPCGYSYVGDYTAATGVHTYSDSSDETCDICGFTRLVLPTAPAGAGYTPMYRLYNPYSGEHFYTGSTEETQNLYTAGWQYEGVAWNAPTRSGEPVYRLYNPNSGDHHYTMSIEEKDMLVGVGWQYEGVCWNSAPADKLPLYRLWNPNADCGSHHYTGSTEERDMLVSVGWIYEGIGWFGLP